MSISNSAVLVSNAAESAYAVSLRHGRLLGQIAVGLVIVLLLIMSGMGFADAATMAGATAAVVLFSSIIVGFVSRFYATVARWSAIKAAAICIAVPIGFIVSATVSAEAVGLYLLLWLTGLTVAYLCGRGAVRDTEATVIELEGRLSEDDFESDRAAIAAHKRAQSVLAQIKKKYDANPELVVVGK